ncbi:MAG: hypothetical protein GX158_06795 [Bacteroidales bacterium]|nr:hypothetical protein [Bacteroidales bacterium]
MRKIMVFTMFTAAVFFASCSLASKHEKWEKEEEQQIMNYLGGNPDLDFEKSESGLYYLDIVIGNGMNPLKGDSVFINYTGYLLDGRIFDSNEGRGPLAFPVGIGWAIPGFDEGVMRMKKGGKAMLLIPSSLAYRDYTPLLFEVELDSIIFVTE